jgi:hypothetical protein
VRKHRHFGSSSSKVKTPSTSFSVNGRAMNVQGNGGFTAPNGVRLVCSFSGSLAGQTITGTMTYTTSDPPPGLGGSANFPVTLAKQ